MTLQNGLVHGSKAFLWCDTAYFDMTGAPLGFDTKAMVGQLFPWAGIWSIVGGRPLDIFEAVDAGSAMTVDRLLQTASEALRSYAAKGHMARLLLATWQDRPQLWLVSTDQAAGEPFVPCEAVHYLNTGNDLPEYHRAARKGLTPSRMARVINAQLAAPAVTAAGAIGEAGQCVRYGGEVREFKVSRDGITARVLRLIRQDDSPSAEAA